MLLGVAGCASQGPLQAPSLHLPARVQGLSAQRFGDSVELHWTTPTKTTDGVMLETKHRYAGPYTAEICRGEAPLAPGPCTPIALLPVTSGRAGMYQEVLTAAFSQGPARILRYRVRILNAKKRGAEGSEVDVAAGAAVPKVEGLRAAPAAGGGVSLRWQPIAGSSDRVSMRVVRGAKGVPETLMVESRGVAGDPGGAQDSGAKLGVEQTYSVYRTRVVEVEKFRLTTNSEPTMVTVSATAAAPAPSAPTGLEAVVNTLGAPEVDLVWQAADEAGVTGYVVFRSEGGGAFVQVTQQPVRGFSYADTAVRAGARYRYRVAAVNGAGLVGAQSAEIERAVPAP
jgi:hypothetical protein